MQEIKVNLNKIIILGMVAGLTCIFTSIWMDVPAGDFFVLGHKFHMPRMDFIFFGNKFCNWLYNAGQGIAWVCVFWAIKIVVFEQKFWCYWMDFFMDCAAWDLIHVTFFPSTQLYIWGVQLICWSIITLYLKILLDRYIPWFHKLKII